jgi:uncharacterized protein YllA (UPF0747 family)
LNKPINFIPPSVVSGHQVGLMGGSLFVLYKILGVYKLAAEKQLRPIYWLESNDADFDEIRYFYGLSDKGDLKKFYWNPDSSNKLGRPIGEMLIDKPLHNLFDQFFKYIPKTIYSCEVKDLVYTSYSLGRTLKEANRFFFQTLFEKQLFSFFKFNKPIIWFDPSQPNFRKFSQSLLQKEIVATPLGKQCPVFALIKGQRKILFKKKDYCQTRSGEKVCWTQETLLPSLYNRSLLQDVYLNASYYIAGPSEENYLANLKPYYQKYNIIPAHIQSRMSATILDKPIKDNLRLLNFTVQEFMNFSHYQYLQILQQRELGYDFYHYKKNIFQFKEILLNKLFTVIPSSFKKTSQKNIEKIIYQEIKHFIGEQRKNFKNNQKRKLRLAYEIENFLFPFISDNKQIAQERIHNLVTILNRYGFDVIKKIYEQYFFENKEIFL